MALRVQRGPLRHYYYYYYYALQQWRYYLEGAEFTVNTDHLNHKWFQSKRDLFRRQAKWSLWLESYYGSVPLEYKAGKDNLSDPLSRRPDLAAMHASTPILSADLVADITAGYAKDSLYTGALGRNTWMLE